MAEELFILVVEDVPADAELIERQLRKAGMAFRSTRVDTREDFLKALKELAPDVILSDYSMPRFDGMKALLLAKELSPSTPFIVVTGSINEHTAVACMKAGASDYVLKESLGHLPTAIESALGRKRIQEEKAEAEKALTRQTDELVRSNKELEQFAFIASHDLQEPARKMIMFCDLLRLNAAPRLDGASLEYLDRVQGAALRMTRLVDDLLHYAMVTAKPAFMGTVSLEELLQDVLSDLEDRITSTNARINIQALPAVKGDPRQLRRLFHNLLDNALKFSKAGEPPRIEIAGREVENGFTELTIEDNGIGFEEKYLERIFLPLQRLHGPDEFPGTGMGLTLCQRIVQRHGGQITARSTPGKGTVFIVTLPVPVGSVTGVPLQAVHNEP